jgi:hypothetical protein
MALEAVLAVAEQVDRGCYLSEKEETGQTSAIEEAAQFLQIDHKTVRRRLEAAEKRYGLNVTSYTGSALAPDELEELGDGLAIINQNAEQNAKYIHKHRTGSTRICPVRAEPFGVAIFGDMHADNKGTDLAKLKRDLRLCATSGVRAVNIGDTLDNFHYTGKLASKQAQNRMTDKDGLAVARYIIRDSGVKWDAHILGNHDAWAGAPYAHLFQEWARQAKTRFYDWMVRLEYHWDGGQFSLLCAHDFKGNSIHNPLHGLFRRAKDDGTADGYAAGHRHNAADASFENGFRGRRYHFARVGSYKKADTYARNGGFDEQRDGESAMFVIDPLSEDAIGRCRVHPSIEEGLEALTAKRRNYSL